MDVSLRDCQPVSPLALMCAALLVTLKDRKLSGAVLDQGLERQPHHWPAACRMEQDVGPRSLVSPLLCAAPNRSLRPPSLPLHV